MPRAFLLHLMNLALAAMATAQNLVPNPSFEDTTHCSLFQPPYEEAVGWYSANLATPDIFDCDTVDPCGIFMDPTDTGIQVKGYRTAYDGNRLAGGFHWYGTDSTGSTREYLSAKLLAGLEAGRSYRVSLYCARPKGHRRAIDHIGVYFGPDSIHEQHTTVLPFSPQIQLRDPNNAYLLDTNWVELADTLVAQGNERWLVIGTFQDDPQVNGIDLPPLFPQPKAYYYIDAVSVVPLYAEAVEEQLAGYAELSATSEMIRWISSEPLRSLSVIDAAGRVVWQPRLSESREGGILVPSSLAQGLYTVIAYMGGQRRVVRFIK